MPFGIMRVNNSYYELLMENLCFELGEEVNFFKIQRLLKGKNLLVSEILDLGDVYICETCRLLLSKDVYDTYGKCLDCFNLLSEII